MGEAITRDKWRWYLVVDDEGNVEEAFNSFAGAADYAENYGGTIIPVKEVDHGTNS